MTYIVDSDEVKLIMNEWNVMEREKEPFPSIPFFIFPAQE